jgi:hypothetical protein
VDQWGFEIGCNVPVERYQDKENIEAKQIKWEELGISKIPCLAGSCRTRSCIRSFNGGYGPAWRLTI